MKKTSLRKWLSVALAFTLLLGTVGIFASAESSGDYVVNVNGAELSLDTAVTELSGHLYIPVRHVFEAAGAKVTWEDETQTVLISLDGSELKIALGSDTAVKDG